MNQTFDSKDLDFQAGEQVLEKIRTLRETKGAEKKTLKAIKEALLAGHSFVIALFWEEALVFQHTYMTELARGKGGNKAKKALEDMEKVVLEAKHYIEESGLTNWESRLYRFLGRINDYKGEFDKSILCYKRALVGVKKDPDSIKSKLPRHLEIEILLSYARMMSGDMKKGLEELKKLYKTFDVSPEARELKRKDYTVWAVWRTGIPIRVGEVYLATGKGVSREKLLSWLDDAEVFLRPRNKKVWADFKYRRNEIAFLRKALKN